jgi:hypothetical protein
MDVKKKEQALSEYRAKIDVAINAHSQYENILGILKRFPEIRKQLKSYGGEFVVISMHTADHHVLNQINHLFKVEKEVFEEIVAREEARYLKQLEEITLPEIAE